MYAPAVLDSSNKENECADAHASFRSDAPSIDVETPMVRPPQTGQACRYGKGLEAFDLTCRPFYENLMEKLLFKRVRSR